MRINLRVFRLRGMTSLTKRFWKQLWQPVLSRDAFCIGCHGPGPCQVRASSQFYHHDNSEDSQLHLPIDSLSNFVFTAKGNLTVFPKSGHGPGGAQVRGTQESIRD